MKTFRECLRESITLTADGTFQVQDKSTNNIWYAIINTDIKLTKI